MILHYLSDGSIVIAISYEKELFYVPLVFVLKVSVKLFCMYHVVGYASVAKGLI